MTKEKYRNLLLQVQRKITQRITSAYRTVSMEATRVMAGLIPVHLQVRERSTVYDTPERRDELRKETMV